MGLRRLTASSTNLAAYGAKAERAFTMCGIAGVFSNGLEGFDARIALSPVLSRLARRGPDGQGISHGQGWALGHRRLAIIDARGGAQPFADPAGSVLSYNGELYNFDDLKDELRAAGAVFATVSDTEVVLKAWMAWGPDCLKRFNGMFAFAIYDPRRDSIFLARDHLGIKPLFYHVGPTGFYFASSMAALLAFKDIPAVADPVGISHYLTTTHVVMGDRTLVKGVFCLEPGTWMEVRRDFGKNPPKAMRYWQLPDQPSTIQSFEDAVGQTRALVNDAVRQQLVSDVPVGGFLSGGIDSTIITSQASRLREHSFNAYSVGYEREPCAGESYNEWTHSRDAAAFYGINCTEIVLDENDYVDDWKFLIAEKGQPLSTPNEVGIYRLAMAVRRDFTVALSGEGADEIFGGYAGVYFSAKDFERAQHMHDLPPEAREPLSASLKRKYGDNRFDSLLDHYLLVTSVMNSNVKFGLLRPELKAGLRNDEALLLHYRERFDAMTGRTPVDTYMRLLLEKNLQSLLFRLDSSTMAASVEGRVPFTDPRLVSLILPLPDDHKIDWCAEASDADKRDLNAAEADARGLIRSKILLRAAFADAIPASILNRRKMSFPVPFRQWFAGPLRGIVESHLRESLWARDWLRTQSVDFLLARLYEPAYAGLVWPLLNLCLWQEAMGISWELED
jgi:asparagine synthase (glutamine-hydrolysing)